MSSKSFESVLNRLCRDGLTVNEAFDSSSALHALVATSEVSFVKRSNAHKRDFQPKLSYADQGL